MVRFSMLCRILAFLVSMVATIEGKLVDENRENVVKNPVQLMDLVIKEEARQRGNISVDCSKKLRKSHELFASQQPPMASRTNEGENIGRNKKELTDPLKVRKVWSRWGKWGKCTVSCGEGVIMRRRVCVAGRCANGEAEEQRRPCRQPPCVYQDNVTQLLESHDVD